MDLTLNAAVRTQVRTIDGLSIRFAESEDRDAHALLLSPWPENLFAYEPTWSRLAEHTYLVAMPSGSSTRTSSGPMSAPGPRSSPRL